MSCYVYILRKPCGEPFYVGKGTGDRAYKHVLEAHRGIDYNPFKNRVIRKLAANDQAPTVEIVREFDNDSEAYHFEAKLIGQIGRRNIGTGTLTNITAGGFGVVGYPQTEAVREAKRRGAVKRFSDPEQRAWAADNLARARTNPAVREKHRVMVTATHRLPENRERAAARASAHWKDPDYRARQVAAHLAHAQSDGVRAAMSVRHQKLLATGFRANTKSVLVEGIEYPTMKFAAEANGLKLSALSARFRRYVKKGEFPAGWGYVEMAA